MTTTACLILYAVTAYGAINLAWVWRRRRQLRRQAEAKASRELAADARKALAYLYALEKHINRGGPHP